MGQVVLKALNKITMQFFIRVITIKRFLLHLHLSLQAPNLFLCDCMYNIMLGSELCMCKVIFYCHGSICRCLIKSEKQ